MAKRFPLEIFISATDKATAVLNRVSDRIDRFYQPFNRLRKAFGEFADRTGLSRVGTALQSVGAEALAVGRKLAIGLSVATVAVGAFIKRQVDAADAVGDTAARLNISTDALQAYQYGFEQADVDQQAFVSSLDTLNKNLGLAKIGMGKALPLFRALALDPKKFKTIDQLLPALANRLSRIHDPAKRAAIATKLLGDAGAQMALKLAEGPQALEEMMRAAKAAGAIIGGQAIDDAGKLDQMWKSLRATFSGVAGNVLGRLSPALLKIGAALQAAIIAHMPQIMAFADQFANNLPRYIAGARDAFNSLRDVVSPVLKLFSWLSEKIGVGNTVLTTLAVIVGGKLLIALGSLGVALTSLGVSMSVAFGVPALIVAGVAAVVAAGWWLYKNWDKVWIEIGDRMGWYVEIFTGAWELIKKTAVTAFEWIVDKMKIIWDNSPLGLLFRGVGAIMDRIQGASGSAPASTPPAGGRLLGPLAAPRQQVDVKVDLSNLPPGTRATATASSGIGFELSRGYAMPGATGGW